MVEAVTGAADQNGSAAGGVVSPGAGAAEPGGAPPQNNTPWFGSIKDPDLNAWATNKGFESPEVAMKSYHNLEKLIGQDRAGRTVVLPGENATPEETAAFLAKIGRPDKPDGYDFSGEGLDADFVTWAKGAFHEAGVPAGMAKTLTAKYQEMAEAKVAASAEAIAARNAEDVAGLRKEWGAAFQDKSMVVERAAREFGLGDSDLAALRDAMGPSKAMKFLEKIGSSLGEGAYVSSDGGSRGSGAMTPDQARAEIKMLQKDSGFVAKYTSNDTDAKRKMEQLHKWAYPE